MVRDSLMGLGRLARVARGGFFMGRVKTGFTQGRFMHGFIHNAHAPSGVVCAGMGVQIFSPKQFIIITGRSTILQRERINSVDKARFL